jgi:hypothetical protein
MGIESHDYIIITIIAGIIILQVWVFVVNIRKIGDYKKTIRQAKNFEIIEVEVPEEWIKEIEVKEILGNPEAFRKLSANFNKQGSDEVSVNKNNSSNDISENTESENLINENDSSHNNSIKNDSIPEELDFPIEEFENEPEIEEYEEDDFEFEEEEYKVNRKSNR